VEQQWLIAEDKKLIEREPGRRKASQESSEEVERLEALLSH
jgi:hypothetical protein